MNLRNSVLACVLLAGLCSCSKDPVQPKPVPVEKASIKITLRGSYLGGAQVDSAFLTWKIGTQSKRVKLDRVQDTLKVRLDEFTEGNGELSVIIYSNKKFGNQYHSQWLMSKIAQLSHNTTLSMDGPHSFQDEGWKPRVDLKDGIGHRAVIGLRPDDPYFMVENLKPQVIKLTVDRSYWKLGGGIQLVGQGIWRCTTGCTDADGDVVNDQFFSNLPEKIGQSAWNHISFVVLYEINQNGEGWVLNLEHDL